MNARAFSTAEGQLFQVLIALAAPEHHAGPAIAGGVVLRELIQGPATLQGLFNLSEESAEVKRATEVLQAAVEFLLGIDRRLVARRRSQRHG